MRVDEHEPELVANLPSGEKIPFIVGVGFMEGRLRVSERYVCAQPVKILRDTGCTGVVIKRKYVTPEQLIGGIKRYVFVDSTVRVGPVARVRI